MLAAAQSGNRLRHYRLRFKVRLQAVPQVKVKVKVLIDTTVGPLAFRRDHPDAAPEVVELNVLSDQFCAAIIGPIRQEVLSEISSESQFETLREVLSAFVDEPFTTRDFELTARFFKQCRARGVQSTHTDFLIGAVGFARDIPIFTTDKDFLSYSRLSPIRLHQASRV